MNTLSILLLLMVTVMMVDSASLDKNRVMYELWLKHENDYVPIFLLEYNRNPDGRCLSLSPLQISFSFKWVDNIDKTCKVPEFLGWCAVPWSEVNTYLQWNQWSNPTCSGNPIATSGNSGYSVWETIFNVGTLAGKPLQLRASYYRPNDWNVGRNFFYIMEWAIYKELNGQEAGKVYALKPCGDLDNSYPSPNAYSNCLSKRASLSVGYKDRVSVNGGIQQNCVTIKLGADTFVLNCQTGFNMIGDLSSRSSWGDGSIRFGFLDGYYVQTSSYYPSVSLYGALEETPKPKESESVAFMLIPIAILIVIGTMLFAIKRCLTVKGSGSAPI